MLTARGSESSCDLSSRLVGCSHRGNDPGEESRSLSVLLLINWMLIHKDLEIKGVIKRKESVLVMSFSTPPRALDQKSPISH